MAPGVAFHLMQCCLRIVYHLVIFVLFDFYFRQHAGRTNQVCESYLEEGKDTGLTSMRRRSSIHCIHGPPDETLSSQVQV